MLKRSRNPALMGNRKILVLLFLILHFTFLIRLSAEDTWIIDLPYQDLYPDDFYYPDSYNLNVIPAIGGGYLATAFVNPGSGPLYWREMLFWKVNSQGDVEWRLQNTNDFEDTYFSTMVSNGVDRYYAMSFHMTWTNGRSTLFILDEECNVVSTHDYFQEDGLTLWLSSIKLLEDGLIMVGRLYEEAVYSAYVIVRTDLEGNIIWIKDDRDFGIITGYPWGFRAVIPTIDNGFLACGNYGTGYLMKFNAEGDTLWTASKENSRFHNITVLNNNIYLLSLVNDGNPWHTYLIKFDEEGNFVEENILLAPLSSQSYRSYIAINQDNDFVVLHNSQEGEIHKVTPEGEILWSYDYFIYSDDLIGSGADNLLIDNAGYYVYNATIDEWTGYPDFKLVRTDPDGIVPVEDTTVLPVSEVSLSNYPNPFNPSTKIEYSVLDDNSNVELSIFNLKGQKITTLVNERKNSGKHSVMWDAEGQSSGIYLIRVSNNHNSVSSKCLLIK